MHDHDLNNKTQTSNSKQIPLLKYIANAWIKSTHHSGSMDLDREQ